jgi:hypothetical protein
VEFLPELGNSAMMPWNRRDDDEAYASVAEARAGLGRYLNFYNGRRSHSSLGARTPDAAYFTQAPLLAAA